jgi:hypothetical protein
MKKVAKDGRETPDLYGGMETAGSPPGHGVPPRCSGNARNLGSMSIFSAAGNRHIPRTTPAAFSGNGHLTAAQTECHQLRGWIGQTNGILYWPPPEAPPSESARVPRWRTLLIWGVPERSAPHGSTGGSAPAQGLERCRVPRAEPGHTTPNGVSEDHQGELAGKPWETRLGKCWGGRD